MVNQSLKGLKDWEKVTDPGVEKAKQVGTESKVKAGKMDGEQIKVL